MRPVRMRGETRAALLGLALLTGVAAGGQSVQPGMALRVSDDGRFLVKRNGGAVVFLLGDTVWPLAHRLTREEMIHYLEVRRNMGFNLVFFSGVAEFGGLGPNAHGHQPFHPSTRPKTGSGKLPVVCTYPEGEVLFDFTKPRITPGADPGDPEQYDYWDHLEFFVAAAGARGIYAALNPVMATCYLRDGHVDESNAEEIGLFFGRRFGKYGNVIWVLGGDIPPDLAPGSLTIHRRMARGLALGAVGKEDYSTVLISFHPEGRMSSATRLHDEPWLAFNMQQSGHGDDAAYESFRADYERTPPKPVLDGEAWYEALPMRIRLGNRPATAFDVRKRAYWAVFSGAFGHIYGENSVMQLWAPGIAPYENIETIHWRQALERPGAMQLGQLRRLIESRPMQTRVPDQSLIVGNPWSFNDRIQATRGLDYAFLYSTAGNFIEVRLGLISGDNVKAWWFNPRDGSAVAIGVFPNSGTARFQPPTRGVGQDWVLVLDDAAKAWPAPGGNGPLPASGASGASSRPLSGEPLPLEDGGQQPPAALPLVESRKGRKVPCDS